VGTSGGQRSEDGGTQRALTVDSALRLGGTQLELSTDGGQRSEARRNAALVLTVNSALKHGGMERTMPLDSTAGWRALKNEETGDAQTSSQTH